MTDKEFDDGFFENLSQYLESIEAGKIKLSIISKDRKKDDTLEWNSEKTKIDKDVQETFLRVAKDMIKSHRDYALTKYNPAEGKRDGKIQYVALNDLPSIKNIVVSDGKADSDVFDVRKIKKREETLEYSVKIGDKLFAFDQIPKGQMLEPRKYLHFVVDSTGKFSTVDGQYILSVPSLFQCLIYEEKVIIFKTKSFEAFFDLRNEYKKQIEGAKKELSEIVDNPIRLIDLVYGDIRTTRKLYGIVVGLDPDKFKGENARKKIDSVIKDYDLKIEFDKDGKIKMGDNTSAKDVLKLLNEDTVINEITNNRFISGSKERVGTSK